MGRGWLTWRTSKDPLAVWGVRMDVGAGRKSGRSKFKKKAHCQACGGPGETRHHLVPQAVSSKRGPVVTLCHRCHGEVHRIWGEGHRFTGPTEKAELLRSLREALESGV